MGSCRNTCSAAGKDDDIDTILSRMDEQEKLKRISQRPENDLDGSLMQNQQQHPIDHYLQGNVVFSEQHVKPHISSEANLARIDFVWATAAAAATPTFHSSSEKSSLESCC